MLALLLTTTLLAQDIEAHQNQKTISFYGKVPAKTCDLDRYTDAQLATLPSNQNCHNGIEVQLKKDENAGQEKSRNQGMWVIEYENKH
jgi:type 1 fimbria pilin